MPRLFVGNFEFEQRLAEPQRQLPAQLARLNAELATAWLSIADDGDFMWTPGAIPAEFWEETTAAGLPRLTPIVDWTRFEGAVSLVPWGWSQELYDHGRVHGWWTSAPDPAAVRQINSRRWSAEREAAWRVGLDGAAVCQSLDDVQTLIDRLPASRSEWVLKAEFGMSGRERFVGRGSLRAEAVGWARRRLMRDGAVFFEPWVERLDEVGLLWDVPQRGSPVLVGVAPMLVSPSGHYRGSQFASPSCPLAPIPMGERARVRGHAWWDEAMTVTERAAEEAQAAGYHGPLGIDAMQYRDHAGEPRVRPLQDVNARWTMGRLALGWRHRFPQTAAGYWWHGPASEFAGGVHQCPGRSEVSETLRVVRTCPNVIDGQPVQHVSALVFGEPSAT